MRPFVVLSDVSSLRCRRAVCESSVSISVADDDASRYLPGDVEDADDDAIGDCCRR